MAVASEREAIVLAGRPRSTAIRQDLPMADTDRPPDGAPEPLASASVLQAAWERFRAGDAVACPVDGAPLALAVDASAAIYRFVCTHCGTASEWFESGLTGVRMHGSSDRSPDED
jgi:hypothetical protein